jgi:hypothetical protein
MGLYQNQLISHALAYAAQPEPDDERRAVRVALNLYNRTCTRAWLRQVCSILTRRRQQLLDLSEVEAQCTIQHRHYTGIQTVALDRIRGSDGRCHDFDTAFCPRQAHSRDRWLAIAAVQESGGILPPVRLIQVGDSFFVQDGHHRVSVARASGRRCIEAEVVTWEVAGPLPWEASAPAEPRTSVRSRQATEPVGPR